MNIASIGEGLSKIIGSVDTIVFYHPDLFSELLGNAGTEESKLKRAWDNKKNLLMGRQLYYKFRINPSNLSIGTKKVQSNALTKAGYEKHYHAEGMIQYNYSGSTGYMKSMLDGIGISDIRFSPAWIKFEGFKKFWDEATTDVRMYYDGAVYTGYFDNINHTKDANDAYQMKYTFNFLIYPGQTHYLTTAASLPAVQAALDISQIAQNLKVTIL